MRRKLPRVLTLIALISLLPNTIVYADVAPPEMPPGANLNSDDAGTQVRMVAETVILDIRQDPGDATGAIANTTATFTMRNLGTQEETMRARFPVSFFGGGSDGFGNFPEIQQIAVKVNGNAVSTRREMQPALVGEGFSYQERDEIPWAVFEVTFPPGQDVKIDVVYQVSGFGYYPYEAFRYILETGAGWKDTIGSADIIIRFPYEVSPYNIWLPNETTGYSQTTPDAVLNGNEVRWHFENLEPTAENNIEITLVSPSVWQKVLNERNIVGKNPNDGEAWGRLGKAYKEIAVMPKGYPRTDVDGRQIFELSRQAYEKCLALLPKDALWHYGYAELLWSHYYFDVYMSGTADTEGLLPRVLNELKTSLELDPNNQRAKDLLSWISSSIPGSVTISDTGYVFLALTATPIPPTPFVFVTETPPVPPTATAMVTVASPTTVATMPPAAPTNQPTGSPSICGGSAFPVALLIGTLWWKRRSIRV